MKQIYKKLAEVQRELNAPKNLYNKFGQYYYRNAEGILAAVKPLLGDFALVISDEPVMVGERYYIRATATLTDGEESVSAVAYAREDETKKGMDGCQLTGACSSYARKYALNALLMIDDSKDSDDDSLSPKNPDNEPRSPQRPQKGPENGSVSTVDKLPQAKADEPKPARKQPETAGQYMMRRIGEMKKEYSSDGYVHLNMKGYKAWVNTVVDYVRAQYLEKAVEDAKASAASPQDT